MKHALVAAAALFLAASPRPTLAHDPAAGGETSTRIFEHKLPNAPGRALTVLEVDYPPGAATPSHSHPRTAFVYAYVLSGAIESAVDDGPPRVYRAGESWHELPGAHHRVSRNASSTEPARLLAVFVADDAEDQLVFPDLP